MYKTEAPVIALLTKLLRQIPACYHQKVYLKFTSGFPDLIVGYRGGVAFYEVKPIKDTLEHAISSVKPIQRATLLRMRECGMSARVLLVESPEVAYLYQPLTFEDQSHWTMKLEDFSNRFLQDPLLR